MNRSEKFSIPLGFVLEACAIFFICAILMQFFAYGAAQPPVFKIGAVLFSVYGFSSILVPVFLFVAGLLLFFKMYTFRSSVYLGASVVPFASVVFAEHIAKYLLATDNSALLNFKVAAVFVICALLVAIEYLLIGILADFLSLKRAENAAKDAETEEIQNDFAGKSAFAKTEKTEKAAEPRIEEKTETEPEADSAKAEESDIGFTPKGIIEKVQIEEAAAAQNEAQNAESGEEREDEYRSPFTVPSFVPYKEQIAQKGEAWNNYKDVGDFVQKPQPGAKQETAEPAEAEPQPAPAEETAEKPEDTPVFVNFKRIINPGEKVLPENHPDQIEKTDDAEDLTEENPAQNDSPVSENYEESTQYEPEAEADDTPSIFTPSKPASAASTAAVASVLAANQPKTEENPSLDILRQQLSSAPATHEEIVAPAGNIAEAVRTYEDQTPVALSTDNLTSQSEAAFLQNPFAPIQPENLEPIPAFDDDEEDEPVQDFFGGIEANGNIAPDAEEKAAEPAPNSFADDDIETNDDVEQVLDDEDFSEPGEISPLTTEDVSVAEEEAFKTLPKALDIQPEEAVPVYEDETENEEISLEIDEDEDFEEPVISAFDYDDTEETEKKNDGFSSSNFLGNGLGNPNRQIDDLESADEDEEIEEVDEVPSIDQLLEKTVPGSSFGAIKPAPAPVLPEEETEEPDDETSGDLEPAEDFDAAETEIETGDEDDEDISDSDYEEPAEETAEAGETATPKPVKPVMAYSIPAEGLLETYPDNQYWIIDAETQRAANILKQTLSEFKIEAEVTGIRKGPVITMFEILPAPGVKLNRIVALQDNIALRLAASSVRIVAPIPGKHAVGIEVPNKERAIVGFKELIDNDSPLFNKMEIPVVLGKDITGEAKLLDLAATPHLLIAGSTGSGKSVCVNTMILSILYKRSPQQVKMILIDPKIVELKLYNDIPHLLTPVITEPKKAFQSLQYCLCEMERRYALLDHMGVRDIKSYNKRIDERHIANEKLPYIVVIIDEFADLMATTGKELESTVSRLAAMSRAVGIHLVLATQRPSVDVITGLIKANIPTRIAFMVAAKMDSRIIIDQVGAEKLLGKGDMLYASAVDPFPVRIQGTYVTENEVENVVEYVKRFGEPEYIDEEIFFEEEEEEPEQSLFMEGEDPLYEKALDIVLQAGKASASYIQRRLKIGYNRAARLVEEMEDRGIVGPANGSKPRDVIHVPSRPSPASTGEIE